MLTVAWLKAIHPFRATPVHQHETNYCKFDGCFAKFTSWCLFLCMDWKKCWLLSLTKADSSSQRRLRCLIAHLLDNLSHRWSWFSQYIGQYFSSSSRQFSHVYVITSTNRQRLNEQLTLCKDWKLCDFQICKLWIATSCLQYVESVAVFSEVWHCLAWCSLSTWQCGKWQWYWMAVILLNVTIM